MASEREERDFARSLDGTEHWLRAHFASLSEDDALGRVAVSLRRYIRKARRECIGTGVAAAELERRRKKIERSFMSLWQARFES